MADTCSSLAAEIAALRSEVERLGDKLESDIELIAHHIIDREVNPKLQNIDNKITNYQNSVPSQIDTKVNTAETELSGRLSGRINAIKPEIENDLNRVMQQAIANTLDKLKGDIAVLNNRINKAQGTADTAHAKATKVEGDVTRAEKTAGEAKSTANTAYNQTQTQASRIGKVEKDAELTKGLANQAKNDATAATNEAKAATKTATSSLGEVRNATREAMEAKGGITGLQQEIKTLGTKFSGQVSALESKVTGLASKVGEAIADAGEALGISRATQATALKALGRAAEALALALNIATAIVDVINTIHTLETLGARIDAIEAGLDQLGNFVSGILGKILQLQNRIARTEGLAGSAQAIAAEARSAVSGAISLATQAISTATSSQSLANGAQQIALGAITKSQQAQVTASSATSEAHQAATTATTALNTAHQAESSAANATNKATNASTTASAAKDFAKQAFDKAVNTAGKLAALAVTVYSIVATVQALKGLRGLQGIPGKDGKDGKPGLDGRPGKNGITTVIQAPGIPGRQGEPGKPGIRGLDGRPGLNGKDGKDGKDVNPGDLAGLKAFIAAQHTQTRATATTLHTATRNFILTPIMAVVTPILVLCQKIFDIVSKATDAAQLALLTIINNKLGVQVVGGLSGFIKTIAENTYIEKALAVLTFAATMHNALMLSNNLGQTLIGIIDQVLGFILPKGIDGTPINFSEVLKKAVHEVIADTIGEANYTTLVEDWQKANRIYQAGINVFNQIGNAVGLVTAGMEVIGGNVAKIGNALKIWGVIGEKAYSWMNPQPNLKGKFFNFINTATDKANTIAMVVAIPIGMSDAAIEINSSIGAIKKELNQEDPKDKNGNPITDKLGNPLKWEPGVTVPDPTKTVIIQEQAKADSTNIIAATLEDIFDGSD